jgi:GTP cyclohydrolase I
MGEHASMSDKLDAITILNGFSWETVLAKGIQMMCEELGLNDDHVSKTPDRFVAALHEYTNGYKAEPGPKGVLFASFEESKYNQMIWENDIAFISHCMHHIAPFAGKVHFGYIPNGKIVGISKIPRLVEILSHRLQIQEKLSDQIVDTFNEVVRPQGCGVVIEAVHFCVCARGVKKTGAYTRTVSLRGTFLESEKTKYEFLDGAKSKENSLL